MIVIPMAGMSSRFFKAGYNIPKYQLQAHGKSLFEWSVRSFEKYFETERFVFICRDVYETRRFIELEALKMGVKNYEIVILKTETRGQAETVALALESQPSDEGILIFNIDTVRRNFNHVESECDGYLEVFKGEGEHWSFIEPGENGKVIRTTEKNRISDLCSNGMYYFKNKELFFHSYGQLELSKGELYVAPMYNSLIKMNKKILYREVSIEDHVFMGTPSEYNDFLNDYE